MLNLLSINILTLCSKCFSMCLLRARTYILLYNHNASFKFWKFNTDPGLYLIFSQYSDFTSCSNSFHYSLFFYSLIFPLIQDHVWHLIVSYSTEEDFCTVRYLLWNSSSAFLSLSWWWQFWRVQSFFFRECLSIWFCLSDSSWFNWAFV